ncbi:MAG: 6,7-dimethyl-8-ribityllumazine synthase [Bradymonadia bacterium]|jgi:6,7-dimethyl-8-ribityllumazine synthase
MPRTIEGSLVATGLKFAVVVGRWNSFIAERMLEGSLDTINRHGGDTDAVDIVRVPGAFEIPFAAKKLADSGRYDAVICLGVLIRGSTPHFDYIASEATKGIATASMDSGVPVSFGVLTVDTIEQAIERAGTKAGNKGTEAAASAIEMANLYKSI